MKNEILAPLESHLESVKKSEWCTKTSSGELNSYGVGYRAGLERALELVKVGQDPAYKPSFMKW